MKRLLIIFTVISIVFITTSCEDDIFDRQPLDKISDSDVWDDPALLRSYLTDAYQRMPFNHRLKEGLSDNLLEIRTDIATINRANPDYVSTAAFSRTNDPIPYWNYSLIRDVNVFIDNIGNASVAQTTKDLLEGEARVLRAMIYFEMQKRYGGVPLVDVPLDPFNPIDQKYTKRNNEETIADFIDNDLEVAVTLLSENNESLGMINKWTAYAVKARANLWAASIAKYGTVQLNGLVGIPSGRANEFYTKASDAANAVISSGKYSLFNQINDRSENFRVLFLTEENGEAIFSKKYDGVNIFHAWNLFNLPQSISGGRGGWLNPLYDYILAVENIDGSPRQPSIGPEYLYDYAYQAFENKDPRIKAVIFFDGDEHAGYTIRTYEGIDPSLVPNPNSILNSWGQTYKGMPQVAEDSRLNPSAEKSTSTGFLVKKFCADEVFLQQSKTPWMEYRLAEMYLTQAEAEFELGNKQEAATALNATRERAGISLVDQSTITLDHVRTERMSELAWEEHRWWDLRRWRIAEEVLNLRTMQGLRTIYHYETGKIYFLPLAAESFARIFREEHYYNPITDKRINNNVDLVENPGY